MVLPRLHGKALVRPELARIGKPGVCLLVKNRFRVESVFPADFRVAYERARTRQLVPRIRSQVLVMGIPDVVVTFAKIEFVQVCRIGKVSIEQIALLVSNFSLKRRLLEPSLLAFDDVAADGRIPVVVRSIVETDVAHVVALHLVATELGREESRLASALQGCNNHREHSDRHIGNVQDHWTRRDGFLRFHHHAATVKVKVLVRRIVTGAKVAAGNLDSLVRKPAHLHAVELLVILEGRRIVDFANAAVHVVFETHPRQRRVLRFAEYRLAACHKHAVLLVEPDGIRIERRRTVLELRRIVQIKRFLFHVVDEVHGAVFDGIRPRGVVHPVHLGSVLDRLLALLKFKTRHLRAKHGGSIQGTDCKQQNGP